MRNGIFYPAISDLESETIEPTIIGWEPHSSGEDNDLLSRMDECVRNAREYAETVNG